MRLSLMTLRRWIIAVAIIGALLAVSGGRASMGTQWDGRPAVDVSYRVSKAIYKTSAHRARHARAVRSNSAMRTRPRIRLRTALLAIAALASMLAAYRLVREHLAYCRELADFYDASANNAEVLARWEGLSVEYGRSPDPAATAAMRHGAAKWVIGPPSIGPPHTARGCDYSPSRRGKRPGNGRTVPGGHQPKPPEGR